MVENPLKSYIPDSVFEFLVKNNLLREKGVRDFIIRQYFHRLKKEYSTQEAIDLLQKEYPYLQYETIRKIIYQKHRIKERQYFYLF